MLCGIGSCRLGEYQFLLINNDLFLWNDITFQSPVSQTQEVKKVLIFAEGLRGGFCKGHCQDIHTRKKQTGETRSTHSLASVWGIRYCHGG